MADLEQQIQQWFAAIDQDRTGSITAAELQRAMALGGLHFSMQACAQVGGGEGCCPLLPPAAGRAAALAMPASPPSPSRRPPPSKQPQNKQMVRLHDRDNSNSIGLQEFRSLHQQLTEIKAAWTAAAAGGDSISADALQQLVERQGAGGWRAGWQPAAAGAVRQRGAPCCAPKWNPTGLLLLLPPLPRSPPRPQATG